MVAGALIGISSPAQAATATDAARSAPPPAAGSPAITVRRASTEQILAMAAQGKGQLITLGAKASPGQDARDAVAAPAASVVCVLSVGIPYGGGAYNHPVYVTAEVDCNNYLDFATLTVELFHGNDAVGTNYGAFVNVAEFDVTAASAGCQDGIYYGAAFGTITLNGQSDSNSYVGLPLNMGCAPPPPPPPAPLTVGPVSNQQSLDTNHINLQMTATGGTAPYTWSATARPTGLSINASTGLITGITRQTGWYPVVVTAVDAAGRSASTQFTWVVKHDGCARC